MGGIYHVAMGDGGGMVVPTELRIRAGLAEDTAIVLVETTGGLVLLTRDQLKSRVRADLSDLDLVGQLMDDRRRQTAADGAV
jgi:bifunctional DNA-binding transcriptional regulator/antitoxin component of YhaV-PrlF toxin-antitoxin module